MTGEFTWRVKRRDGVNAGARAGCTTENGYVTIAIRRSAYKAHRLAWLYVYGEWPDNIDHINGSPVDNRISNLRSVTFEENGKNMKLNSNNSSGLMGVHWHALSKKWQARITCNKTRLHLGYFRDFFEACCARKSF